MKTNKITMVNPGQIVKRGWKGLKTTQQVRSFATKYKVPSVYWRKPGTNRKVFLVEYDQFCETWREYQKTSVKTKIRKPTTTRKPIARKSTQRSTNRPRTNYRTGTRIMRP